MLAFIMVAAAGSYAAITLHNWATVEVVEAAGVVQVASQDQSESWRTIQSGERMREGERIRTSTDGTATLRFYDGSQIILSPLTDMTLTQVEGGWGGRLIAVLTQQAGETQHVVVPLKTPSSLYQVQTPSGSAQVQGTDFGVTVDAASGSALFAVNDGSVWVQASGSAVLLETGQATVTQPGMAPEDPNYGFQIKGILTVWEDETLEIGGIQLNVSENMLVQGKPAIGEMARAAGHIDESGVWWADLLTSSGGKFLASFTGVLEATGDTIWQVSGTSVLIDSNTTLTGHMDIDTVVKVDFIVLDDGEWLATHIRPHGDDDEEKPKPTPSVTPSPTSTITTTVTVTPTITPTATQTITATPPVTDCVGAELQPTGVTLAKRYGVPYDEIMGWFCQGYGFGEIDLVYGLSQEYGVPVTEIFAMSEAGEGWGNIKKYFEEQITPTPKPTKDREVKPTKTPKPTKDK